VLGAQLKLARIYASGNGVNKDSGRAFYFYRQIANQRADISPLSPVSKYVAEAFVALGEYYVDGIPSAQVLEDPIRAANLLRHAASYFGDADAQYQLARLYLDGEGVEKNVGLAINWLATAARSSMSKRRRRSASFWRAAAATMSGSGAPAGLRSSCLRMRTPRRAAKSRNGSRICMSRRKARRAPAMREEAQNLMPGSAAA
jgi:TPR repeat protein